MSDTEYLNIDRLYAQSRMDSKCDTEQEKVNGINRLIRKCQREYDRLSSAFYKSEVVQGVSGAVGFISAISLLPPEVKEIADAPDLIQTPAGKVILGLSLGSFAVAGISGYIKDKISDKMEANMEEQGELFSDLDYQEGVLTANENVRAINQIKTAIYGDDVVVPEESKFGYESDIQVPTGLASDLPKIVVIDTSKDFPDLPPHIDDDLVQ